MANPTIQEQAESLFFDLTNLSGRSEFTGLEISERKVQRTLYELGLLYSFCNTDREFELKASTLLSTIHYMAGGDSRTCVKVELLPRRDGVKIVGDSTYCLMFDKPLLRPRMSWHEHFMQEAFAKSEMSTCASGRKVGAVFVRNKVSLVSTFNGVPAGYPHPEVCPRIEAKCASGEGLHLCPCNHAEMNGLAKAAEIGVSLRGSTLYCTTKPCSSCMGILANLGLESIIYKDGYSHDLSDSIAEKSKTPLIQIDSL